VIQVRFAILLLCTLLSLLSQQAQFHDLVVITLIALLISAPLPRSWFTTARPLLEGAVAAAIIGSATPLPEALLPYLIVPPIAAGLLSGTRTALATTTVSLLVLVGARLNIGYLPRPELTAAAEWIFLGLAAGLVASWVRALSAGRSDEPSTYMAAHELLIRLRDVARTLPAGLDEVALAQQLLTRLGKLLEFDRAGIYAHGELGVLTPLAFAGSDQLEWQPDVRHGIWGEVLTGGGPAQQTGTFSDPDTGYSAVLALALGERRLALVGFERESGGWTSQELEQARALADSAALGIDAGQLFSEVRTIATAEERRRLAREIHDGIAQEIASVGYVVDDLRAGSSEESTRVGLTSLREDLTRIVTELRLSIFDLRADVQPATGLGAALTGYAHNVGTGSGLTIHLVLDETAHRLPLDTEAELLRVAQEAITNARKHARAHNLWVTCRVDPPTAFMRIADDGQGMQEPREDSFGISIMRERAQRIGATLSVRARVGGGTVVEIALGSSIASSRTARPTISDPDSPTQRDRRRRH